jgi:hypothetical protein
VTVHGRSQFPLYRRLGTQIYEAALFWPSVDSARPQSPTDPRDPAYHWQPQLAAAIAQATRFGMRVMLEVRDAPAWANGGKPEIWIPTHPSYLADFVEAAAREYPTVHLWMVEGEPESVQHFQPETPVSPHRRHLTPAQAYAPRHYAQLLDAAYGALKAVSPRNTVIGGDTYTAGNISPAQWIAYMRLPDGRPPRLDLYGHNPFSIRPPSLASRPSGQGKYDFSDIGRLYRFVNRNLARPGHPIRLFLAEFTIPTAPDDEFNFYTTTAVQAQWIRDAWRIVRSHRSLVYALGWIHIRDNPPQTNGGLEFANGRPKPGFFAWAHG